MENKTEEKEKTLEEEALVWVPKIECGRVEIVDFGPVRDITYRYVEGRYGFAFERSFPKEVGRDVKVREGEVKVLYTPQEIKPSGKGYLFEVFDNDLNDIGGFDRKRKTFTFLPYKEGDPQEMAQDYCASYISRLREKQIELFRKKAYFVRDAKQVEGSV